MKKLKAAFKMELFAGVVVSFVTTTGVLYPLMAIFPWSVRRLVNGQLKHYCSFCLWFMGIKPTLDSDKVKKDEPFLVVSNHLSYLDVLIICSQFPSAFVTSVEIKKTPFLGHLCRLGGCLFVERRSKENLSNEIRELTDGLRRGLNVVIFPEATSTDGTEVIRFRRPLFRSAIDSGRRVQPLTLNYSRIDGEELHLGNRDKVFWYGDMTFIDHLWGVFQLERIEVDLVVNGPIEISKEVDHSALAEASYQVVSGSYRPVTA